MPTRLLTKLSLAESQTLSLPWRDGALPLVLTLTQGAAPQAQLAFGRPVEGLSFTLTDTGARGSGGVTISAHDAAGAPLPVRLVIANPGGATAGQTGALSSDAPVGVVIDGAAQSIDFVLDPGTSTEGLALADLSASRVLDHVVEGTAGDDLIDHAYLGDPEGDRIDAADGPGGTDADSVLAGGGNDTVHAGLGADTVMGGTGNDSLNGNEGDDSLMGGDGNDTVIGETGDDLVSGGAGDDHIEGNEGADTLIGGDGNDWIRGSYDNDALWGGAGDDYLWGGYGDDTFHIEDGFGNDTIAAEDVDEVMGDTLDLSAVTSDLTIDLTDPNPERGSFTDGVATATFEEVENIVLGAGRDTIVLGDISGHDTLTGFAAPLDNGDGTFTGIDRLDVSALHDIDGNLVNTEDVAVTDTNGDGTGDAVLVFSGGQQLTLLGVSPAALSDPAALEAIGIPRLDHVVEGTEGAELIDLVYEDDPDGDRVDHNDAADGSNDDVIEAGAGDDTILAGEGDDRVLAGTGDDQAWGGTGDDTLLGGAGNDTILGEAGSDHLEGGDGADKLLGGDDADRFSDLGAGDTVLGGAGGDDYDVLDFTGAASPGGHITITRSTDSDGNGYDGTVTFHDATGATEGTLTFENIEEIVPCFTPGTPVVTSRGLVAVEALRPGDRVATRDNGFQEVAWVGQRGVDRHWLAAAPEIAPVMIRTGALGQGMPATDIAVSPNHRMLVSGPMAMAHFGEPEVLVAAKHLVGRPGIRTRRGGQVTYVHMLFERHELVLAGGTWSESFQPGGQALSGVGRAQREEIFALFPELRARGATEGRYDAARRILKRHEAQLLGL